MNRHFESRSNTEMTFWEHIGELRRRIVIAVVSIVIAGIVAFCFRELLYSLLMKPLSDTCPDLKLNFLSPTEPFIVYLRLAFAAGITLASPVVLYQGWAFIAPGLKPNEKRFIVPILPVVLLLFIAGVAFVYFIMLPVSLGFLIGYSHPMAEAEITQDRYFGFVSALLLSGGLLFQLPAVMAILGLIGIVNAAFLMRFSGWALIILMSLAAIITPTGDAFNMLILTAPLMILYLIGTFIVWLIDRFRKNKNA